MLRRGWYPAGLVVMALAALSPMAAAQSVGRPDPEEIARRCIERLNRIGEHGVMTIRETTEETVQRVLQLLREGKVEEARRAAAAGIHRILGVRMRHVHAIERIAHRCIGLLRRLHAEEELIAAVRRAAEANIGRVNEAAERGIDAIESLFDHGGE